MIRRILLRILLAIPVTLCASIAVFFLLELAPGDPFQYSDTTDAPPDAVELQKKHFGYGDPLHVRLGRWIYCTLTFDFGTSVLERRPVRDIAFETLPYTLCLSGLALVFGTLLGITIAMICARRVGGWVDSILSSVSIFIVGIPLFWSATWAAGWVGVEWQWLPPGGALSVRSMTQPGFHLWDRIVHLIMPAGILILLTAAVMARFTRASLAVTLQMEFIRAARARGASRTRVLWRHALPASVHSTIAYLGLSIPWLAGGFVIIETVFNYPGTGLLLVKAMNTRDYPVACAGVVILSFLAILGNAVADAVAQWLDPRVEN
ncbi:MAG: ABC transporter permease [Planctomycetota bacterium]